MSFAWLDDQVPLRSLETSIFVKFRRDCFVGFLTVTSCVYAIIFFLLLQIWEAFFVVFQVALYLSGK